MLPSSCDTFCALSDVTAPAPGLGPCVVFGKNSDRPRGEVQELVYVRGREHGEGEQVKVKSKWDDLYAYIKLYALITICRLRAPLFRREYFVFFIELF